MKNRNRVVAVWGVYGFLVSGGFTGRGDFVEGMSRKNWFLVLRMGWILCIFVLRGCFSAVGGEEVCVCYYVSRFLCFYMSTSLYFCTSIFVHLYSSAPVYL